MANNSLKAPRRFATGDLLKVVAAMLMVQASVGASLIEHTMLSLDTIDSSRAEALLDSGGGLAVGLAFLFRIWANVAWPIYAFLGVQGFLYTSSTKGYLIRVAIFALVSEIPYDLAMSGQWFNWADQNGMLSLLIGLVGLTLSEELSRRSKSYMPRVAMLVGCTLWAWLLRTQFGHFVVPAMFAFFYLEEREMLRSLVVVALGLLVAPSSGLMALTVIIPAALACLLLHWYNDRPPIINKWVWYGLYPLHLLILGIVALVK